VVSVTPRPRFTPEERTPGTHCTGGWVGPRAGLGTGARGKILCVCEVSNPDRPVVQPVVRHYTAWANPAPFVIYRHCCSTLQDCKGVLLLQQNDAVTSQTGGIQWRAVHSCRLWTNSDKQSQSASSTVMWVTRESVRKVDEVSETVPWNTLMEWESRGAGGGQIIKWRYKNQMKNKHKKRNETTRRWPSRWLHTERRHGNHGIVCSGQRARLWFQLATTDTAQPLKTHLHAEWPATRQVAL
jgi:hypothetical protein